MDSFHDVRFPVAVSFGATGGPEAHGCGFARPLSRLKQVLDHFRHPLSPLTVQLHSVSGQLALDALALKLVEGHPALPFLVRRHR